jgi:hypothetical protein
VIPAFINNKIILRWERGLIFFSLYDIIIIYAKHIICL